MNIYVRKIDLLNCNLKNEHKHTHAHNTHTRLYK